MNTFTYRFQIPKIYAEKNYDFIFIGFEDTNNNLIKRIDCKYTEEFIFTTLNCSCDHIIFLGYINGDWDEERVELKGSDYFVDLYKDLVLPI